MKLCRLSDFVSENLSNLSYDSMNTKKNLSMCSYYDEVWNLIMWKKYKQVKFTDVTSCYLCRCLCPSKLVSIVITLIVNSEAYKQGRKCWLLWHCRKSKKKIPFNSYAQIIFSIIIALSTSSHAKEFPSDDVRRSSMVFAVTRHYQSFPEQISMSLKLFNRLGL